VVRTKLDNTNANLWMRIRRNRVDACPSQRMRETLQRATSKSRV